MKYSLIISSILLVLIDLVYLSIIGKPVFEKTVSAIQGTKLVVNIPPAIFTYILMAFILNYFIISANKPSFDAFILGFCTYGIFDFTNLSLIDKYPLDLAIIDSIWGGILCALVVTITKYIFK